MLYNQASASGYFKGEDLYGDEQENTYELKMSQIGPAFSLFVKVLDKRLVQAHIGAGGTYHFVSYSRNRMTTNDGTIDNFFMLEKNWFQGDASAAIGFLDRFQLVLSRKLLGDFSRLRYIDIRSNITSLTARYYF